MNMCTLIFKSTEKINFLTLSCGSLTEERICIAWVELVSKKYSTSPFSSMEPRSSRQKKENFNKSVHFILTQPIIPQSFYMARLAIVVSKWFQNLYQYWGARWWELWSHQAGGGRRSPGVGEGPPRWAAPWPWWCQHWKGGVRGFLRVSVPSCLPGALLGPPTNTVSRHLYITPESIHTHFPELVLI